MTKYNFKFTPKKPTSAEAFREASEAELKVLIALMECGGVADEDKLLSITGVSRARLSSAIALWQGEGVIEEASCEIASPYGNTVTDEYEERVFAGELYEQTAKETAITIKNANLASLFDECAKMMGKHMLTPMETRRISSLSSQYGLSDEYIAVLASYLNEKGSFTVSKLVNRAIKLSTDHNIETVEALEEYITRIESESGDFYEARGVLGLYDRKLSKSEDTYIKKWLYEYHFDIAMIAEAYDYTVYTVNDPRRIKLEDVDEIITDWYNAGFKSAAACRERNEQVRAERKKSAAEKKPTTEAKRGGKPKKEKQRFGNFDPEEAFRLALERSFPNEDKNEEG